MIVDLGPSGRAWEYDVHYVEGVTREQGEAWQGYGIRYRPLGAHRFTVIFMDGNERQEPRAARILLAIEQHYAAEAAR